MKLTMKLLALFFAVLMMGNVAYAQLPSEDLQQMVEQLQKSPGDNALREKIIKLATSIKPAPAIPEEANRAFVKGNVFQKDAKDASGYELAISAYREALRSAPWWGDAYFNLSVAQESAGKFDEAIASVKNYMASVPAGSAEAREAQNKIYALEAKGEMAAAKKTEEGKKQELDKQTNKFAKISGKWKNSWGVFTVEIAADSICTAYLDAQYDPGRKVDNCKVVGDKLRLHLSNANYRIECGFSLMPDGYMEGERMGGGWDDGHQKVIKSGCDRLYRP